ncbi:MAG TPA: hypothetical protein VN541_23015 [Tepidisphaeraceae bacterium]|nr:hypothetical protein [Tepidisphaeraceae bacterium]
MRNVRVWLGSGILAGSLLIAGCAATHENKEKKLSPGDIPQAVTNSLNARLPGAKLTSAEKENENGAVVYDLEMTQNGLHYEMDVKEDGTIAEIEKEVKHPPQAVVDAVKQKYPDAKIKIVMEVNKVEGTKETPQNYEATISTGGKNKEVVVALDGSSVKEETD